MATLPEKNVKYTLPKVGYTRTFPANDISRTITNDSLGVIGYSGNHNPSTISESPSSDILVVLRPEDNTALYYVSFYMRDCLKIKIERRGKEDLFVFVKTDVFNGLISEDQYYR